MTVNSTVHLRQWPAQAALEEVARNPTSGGCRLSCLKGKFLLSPMRLTHALKKSGKSVCPSNNYNYVFPCQCMHSGCFALVSLPAPFGGARHGAVQVNHAHAQNCGSRPSDVWGCIAVSLMAHRPRSVSQCQHTLCRCTLALCTQPVSMRHLGILPLLLAGAVVFERHKRRGMHAINNLWSSPGLWQRNYLAIWQNSPDAQEAGWGHSKE